MWEVDPETRSKLHQIQKRDGSGNEKCCDCGAPSPQWASPKFSTFICLTCAGMHRGLGVHVSFVRSISMDAFKQNEILRMQYGGNQAWQDFYNANSTSGATFDETTIKERYDCEVGEEWKERLSAKVEEREFDKAAWTKERAAILQKQSSINRIGTPVAGAPAAGGARKTGMGSTSSTTQSRSQSPVTTPPAGGAASQKSRNEAYFAKLGEVNAARPDGIPPNQGGKFVGFGSSPPPSASHTSDTALPSADEFQKDPVAALTKGFGWFSAAVSKQAKVVNESYLQPTAKNIASSDLAAQARAAALTAGTTLQTGARGAAESLSKFVEGQDDRSAAIGGGGAGFGGSSHSSARRTVEPERKDFWDSFGESADSSRRTTTATTMMGGGGGGGDSGAAAAASKVKPSTVGTSAMKSTGSGPKKDDSGWGDEEDW